MVRKTANQRLAAREERARSELLDRLFEPWIGGAANAETQARLGPVDPDDSAAVEKAIATDILPSFAEMTAETQGRVRDAIGVLARSDGEEFAAYGLDMRPPFGAAEGHAGVIFKALANSLGVRLPDPR